MLGFRRGRSACLQDAPHTRCSTDEGEFNLNLKLSLSCIVSSFLFSSYLASDLSTVSNLGVLLLFVGVGSGGFPGMKLFAFTPGESVF